MPNDSEGPIVVFDNSVVGINLALQQVLERLDMVKGLRGDPTIYAATTVGAPGAQQQAARLADLPSENVSNPLFWIARPRVGGVGAAPTALTDGSGGTANDTLTALGGITVLTDNTAATANDTVENVPACTGDAGGVATVSAAANVATVASVNTSLTAVENDIADLTSKVNTLVADMEDCKNNFADVAAKINALRTALIDAEVLY